MADKITKRLVDGLEPKAERYVVWDSALGGFGIRVTPSGAKTYVLKYRMGGRATSAIWYTMGKHGPLTPEQARKEAERVLSEVARGIDPVAERKAAELRAATIAELADRYLEQHVIPKNKPSTAREFKRLVEAIIKPKLGKLDVEKITRAHVSKWHHDMRETPRQANQALAVLSKMLALSEIWGFRPDGSNPARAIERYKEAKRERFLSDAELSQLGVVLAEMEDEGEERPSYIHAVRLLVMTGCRMGEVVSLRWDDFLPDEGVLVIRDAKAGGRRHAIGAPAIAFLLELDRDSEWILPGPTPGMPVHWHALDNFWRKVRKRAGYEDVHLHDLRHTVGTFAGQTGANAFLVRDKLGHKTLAMTGRYVNRDASPLRELSDKVEGRIVAAMKAGADAVAGKAVDPGKVVPLAPARHRKR